LFTMSLVGPNQSLLSLLLDPICVLLGIGTHQDWRLKHKTRPSQAGSLSVAGEICLLRRKVYASTLLPRIRAVAARRQRGFSNPVCQTQVFELSRS
jgi:hypothetical protein